MSKRAVWVVEWRTKLSNHQWVVFDIFRVRLDANLARNNLAKNNPGGTFRVAKYVPEKP